MFASTQILLIFVLCALSADDVRCIFQWATRLYEKFNYGHHYRQPLVNRKSNWKDLNSAQWTDVLTKEKLIRFMKHVPWPAENSNMYMWADRNPAALQGLSESFLWHFIHIVAVDEDLEKYFKDYNKLFRIRFENGDRIRIDEPPANKFQGLILQTCFDVCTDAIEDEWLNDFHTKAFRGLIFGNVFLLTLMKNGKNPMMVFHRDRFRDVYMGRLRQGYLENRITRTISHFLLKTPVPDFNEWKRRLAHFLIAHKLHALNIELTTSYPACIDNIMGNLVYSSEVGEYDDTTEYIEHIYKRAENGPFSIKHTACSWLENFINEECDYYTYRPLTFPTPATDELGLLLDRQPVIERAEQRYKLEQRKKYYAIFDTLIEYADITMFMIDTEPMKKVLDNIYKAVKLRVEPFKNDLIDFIESFVSIVENDNTYTEINIQFYKNRISSLCNHAFCAAMCSGYPDYWYPNRVLFKAVALARSIVNELPPAFLNRDNIERNYEKLNDLIERYPLEALAIPSVYITIQKMKLNRAGN